VQPAQRFESFIEPHATIEEEVFYPGVKDLIEKRFRVNGLPTLLLLDPNGIVLETRSNELRGDKLIPTIERFMKRPR
jgi:hypothetical protein